MLLRIYILFVLVNFIAFALYVNRRQFWRIVLLLSSASMVAFGLNASLHEIPTHPVYAYILIVAWTTFAAVAAYEAQHNRSPFELMTVMKRDMENRKKSRPGN